MTEQQQQQPTQAPPNLASPPDEQQQAPPEDKGNGGEAHKVEGLLKEVQALRARNRELESAKTQVAQKFEATVADLEKLDQMSAAEQAAFQARLDEQAARVSRLEQEAEAAKFRAGMAESRFNPKYSSAVAAMIDRKKPIDEEFARLRAEYPEWIDRPHAAGNGSPAGSAGNGNGAAEPTADDHARAARYGVSPADAARARAEVLARARARRESQT